MKKRNIARIILKEMTIKSNLNLSRIGLTNIPNDCSYSNSCDSKMNGMREESRKMSWKNNTGTRESQKMAPGE